MSILYSCYKRGYSSSSQGEDEPDDERAPRVAAAVAEPPGEEGDRGRDGLAAARQGHGDKAG